MVESEQEHSAAVAVGDGGTEGLAPYDSVDLVVWSGTGNTRRVAERIAEHARAQGATARILATDDDAVATEGRRLLGFLAPTHGFTAAWPIMKAVATYPGVRGTGVFVVATRGGMRIAGKSIPGFEGTAAYLPALLLALRGARVRGAGAVDMPVNWTVLIPAQADESLAEVVGRGDRQTGRFAEPLVAGSTAFRGFVPLFFGLLILPVSLAYLLIGRLVLAKVFYADERCTSCGTCEKECPHDAIRLRGRPRRPYWSYHCQSCMRCMNNCPTDAIQGGQAWLVFYTWLTLLPVGAVAVTAILGEGPGAEGLAGAALELAIGYLWIIAVVWVAYVLLWFGLRVPVLRHLLARATFTMRYRRYRGPDEASSS